MPFLHDILKAPPTAFSKRKSLLSSSTSQPQTLLLLPEWPGIILDSHVERIQEMNH